MPIFWGNRRGDRHDRRTHISTSGARVIEAQDGRRHHGRHRTVVAVPETNVSTRVTRARRDNRYYDRRNPSFFHGLWTKLLGTLTGNRHRRRRGEREIRKAREQKQALRMSRRARDTRRFKKLRKFRRRPHRKRPHGRSNDPVVIAQDGGRSRHRSRAPWGHYNNRALPSYHGAHHRLFGFLTGRRDRVAQGKEMARAAEDERRRERRRRQEEMMDQGRRYREKRRFLW